jgi:hypothetical protein
LKKHLHPKRARTHDDAGDVHEMLEEVENWDLRDHRQQAHTRLGLVGSISYWCLGDTAAVVRFQRRSLREGRRW